MIALIALYLADGGDFLLSPTVALALLAALIVTAIAVVLWLVLSEKRQTK